MDGGPPGRAGYPQYEISNFAKPGFESRHNLRYWFTRPYIGFGPGAHSDFGGRRYSFVRDLDAYIDGVLHGGNVIDSSELIPSGERCGEYLMLRLRTAQGIDGVEYRRNYFMDFAPLEARLEQFAAQGVGGAQPGGPLALHSQGASLVSNQLIGDLLDRQEQASWEDLIVRPGGGRARDPSGLFPGPSTSGTLRHLAKAFPLFFTLFLLFSQFYVYFVNFICLLGILML